MRYVGAWEHVGHDAWPLNLPGWILGKPCQDPVLPLGVLKSEQLQEKKKEGRRGTIMRIKVTNEQMKGTKCHLSFVLEVGLQQRQNEYHREAGDSGSGNPSLPHSLKFKTHKC